jgi:hypothetical protein
MTYFADGSAYSFMDTGKEGPLVNVGWLGPGHPHQTGVVPEDLVELLAGRSSSVGLALEDSPLAETVLTAISPEPVTEIVARQVMDEIRAPSHYHAGYTGCAD